MALPTLENLKIALDLAATDINTALGDVVNTGIIATELKKPNHPLRRNKYLFKIDAATGQYTTNEEFVDAAYLGRALGQHKNEISIIEEMVLVSATVEAAEPADIVLTFDRNVISGTQEAVVTDSVTPRTYLPGVIATTTVTIVASAAFEAGDAITVSGIYKGVEDSVLQLVAQVVTNNIV